MHTFEAGADDTSSCCDPSDVLQRPQAICYHIIFDEQQSWSKLDVLRV
jgi:hypothetical protein